MRRHPPTRFSNNPPHIASFTWICTVRFLEAATLRRSMAKLLYWLLLLVPLTLGIHLGMRSAHTLVFTLSALSMIPLAHLLSEATENLASRTGPILGALLGVTFGNA